MSTPLDYSNLHCISDRLRRFIPNPQAVGLTLILFFSVLWVYLLTDLLMPVFVSIVLAYLLNGLVEKAEKQIELLNPITENTDKYEVLEAKHNKTTETKKIIPLYFATQKLDFLNSAELDKKDEKLRNLEKLENIKEE